MMLNKGLTFVLLLGAAGCTMKEAAPVDSAAAPDSTAAGVAAPVTPDSTGAAIDSVKANPPVASKKGQTPRDSIIGRDSAFGPIGSIDEKGNVTPIRKQVRK